MKNTKQKILEKSLEIFNEKGYSSTSLRTISQELGMSQGNLNYHFKKKEDLIEALYFQLVEELNMEITRTLQPQSLLLAMFQLSGLMMSQFYAYRFLLRDFYLIMKENPEIKKHYQELQNQRTNEFMQFFTMMQIMGMIREPLFEGEYERFYQRMNILGDNWINAQELLNSELENPVRYYQELLFEVIYPYLTTEGREEYELVLRMS